MHDDDEDEMKLRKLDQDEADGLNTRAPWTLSTLPSPQSTRTHARILALFLTLSLIISHLGLCRKAFNITFLGIVLAGLWDKLAHGLLVLWSLRVLHALLWDGGCLGGLASWVFVFFCASKELGGSAFR